MRKGLKYSLRMVGGLVGFVLLILLLAGLLIQTQPVQDRIARFAEKQAASALNGELSIGRLDGNFFTSLKLSDVLLRLEQDTLASIDELELRYRLWPLLKNKLVVTSASIVRPFVHLKQQADSTWNFEKLVPVSEPDTTSTSSNFKIDVAQFHLTNGNIRINALDTIIPQQIKNLNTELSLSYSTEKQVLELSGLSLETLQPDFTLQQLAFQLRRNQDAVQLTDFQLKTAQNQLKGKAEFDDQPDRSGSADLLSDSLKVSEFEFFLSGFKLPASPVLEIDGSLDGESASGVIKLTDGRQRIRLNLSSANLARFVFEPSAVPLQYQLDANFENIDLRHWLGDPEMNYQINGQLSVNGEGTDPKSANVRMKGDFNDFKIQDQTVKELSLDLALESGSLDGIVQGQGAFGSFELKPYIRNLQTNPAYKLKLNTSHLNLAELTGQDSLRSDINLTARAEGQGFDPKTLQAKAHLYLSPSSLMGIQADTLVAHVQYQHENVLIDSMLLNTKSLHLQADGNYSLRGNSDINLTASLDHLDEFKAFIPIDDIKTSGKLQAHLWGTTDSLHLESTIDLGMTALQDMTIQQLLVKAEGLVTPQDTMVDARLSAYEFVGAGLALDSLAFDVHARPDSVFVDGQIANADLQTQLQAGIRLGGLLRVSLSQWSLDYKNQHFELQDAPAIVEIDSMSYRIDNFKLADNTSDSAQYIMAQGIINRRGNEDFKLNVARVNLNQFLKMLGQDLKAEGLFNLNLQLSGTSDNPQLKADFGLQQATMNDYAFTEFGGTANYSGSEMDITARLVPQDSGMIELSGIIPFQLIMDSLAVNFNPKDSIDARLVVDRFPLAVLQTVDVPDGISGYLQGAVDVKGTVESPDPSGSIRLKNASLRVPGYGIDYREIQMKLNFLRDQMKLDTLLIITEDGRMTGDGEVKFNSDFYKGNVSGSKIAVNFDQFNPLSHKQLNMQVSGDANLGGMKDSVQFGGHLTIPQGEVYLPALFNMMGRMSAPEMPKPILLRELETLENTTIDTLSISMLDSTRRDTAGFDYFDKLTGELQITIPKNTWIKNEDMHIEISGDLEFIKHKEFFELFGSVEVVRGQYDLFGRTFMIETGTISFQGGEELTPRLDITANYNFRNAQRMLQKLTVKIAGTPDDPTVNFALDGSSVSEGDALSYILFGKSMNELSMDQQENVSGAGDIAGKAAASILSSQLTSFLGDKLDVDYIEVKGGGNFDNATVTVGKYITNDLFVSYEQRFGETDEKDIAKYEVKLEYELFKFLFFQLNNSSRDSGFDLIFKFDAE
jgi:translocation and assembly module TamB